MNNKRATKRALLTSVMALVMCVVMLVGTTFAWFTDTASTGVNKIQAGNLNIELQMKDNGGNWVDAENQTLQFKVNGVIPTAGTQILWEPGCRYELPELRIVNKGNLALKYKITVNGVTGDAKLLKAIDFTAKMGADDGIALENLNGAILPSGAAQTTAGEAVGATDPITIKGVMKTTAGNEYQGLSIDGIGITVVATQYTYEKDSIDDQYDANANATIQVNSENIQDYLDGKYGSIDGMTLVLAEGNYGTLELGRATKYPGSNTTYTCPHNEPTIAGGGSVSFANVEDYIAHMINNPHHGDARTFTRTMSNLTITAQEEADVTVEGLTLLARTYGNAKDPFVTSTEKDYIGYNIDLVVHDLAFSNIKFTGKVEIASENRDNTIIDGVTFENCKFETNDIATTNGQAINFSNNVNNGQVKNLIVKNCDFTNCYQGVYTNQVRNVSVTGCTFNTTGHNAIAIQDPGNVPVNHGAVEITNNKFTSIGDRVIRFNNVGADTQITIKGNTATNSGDAAGEVIKATSLASGIKYDISGNNWGTGKTVANTEFADK